MSNLTVKAETAGIVRYGCTATNRGATSERVTSTITIIKKGRKRGCLLYRITFEGNQNAL